ncbi:MAG: DNA polymerase III subunit beta [Bacillaceae bacterium]|nr:DNA polymerase III subunit beta [Bacillaceae bacterium]
MQVLIKRDQLNHAVQHVLKAVSTRTTIPILTGIKMLVTDEDMTLTASNSDISIECSIPFEEDGEEIVNVMRPGSIVLPARYFGEIVKKLPEDTIEIDVKENFLIQIRSGSSEFQLNGLDPEEFPRLPQLEEEKVFSIPADILKTIIRQTVFAVATTETRPILTGVRWNLHNGSLSLVATDSHRLANREANVETSEDLSFENIVIPGKSLTELNKILEDSDQLVDIVITDNQILIKYDKVLFYSRLLDGTYPDTSRIIPQSFKTEMVLNSRMFLQAIERASLLAGESKNNVVKLTSRPGEEVEITSNTQEIGKVTETITPASIQGDEIKISFNAKYMLEALRSIDSDEIKIGFTGSMNPFIIKPTEHDWITQLIVPVRTN